MKRAAALAAARFFTGNELRIELANPAAPTTTEAIMINCPNCGEELLDDAESCVACGHFIAGGFGCARHPNRDAIGHCVVCGTAVCEECDRPDHHHHRCELHANVPVISGWAQVYTTNEDTVAELIRENLEAEGIEARVLSQKDHTAFPVDLGDLAPVRVLVPAYDYEPAVEIIRAHIDEGGDVAFACPNCGEAYDYGETTCAACGHPLPRGLPGSAAT